MAFNPARGLPFEYDQMQRQISEFKLSLRRQLPVDEYRKVYDIVEAYSRTCKPFASQPYTKWLKILHGLWTKALRGDLFAPDVSRAFWECASSGEQAFHNLAYRRPIQGQGQYNLASSQSVEPLQGAVCDSIIIDDPVNQEKPMKRIKVPKPPKKDYNTVGVRFLRGHNLHKVYTYKVAKKAKLRLGEELVVPSLVEGYEANGIAVVVELHKTPQDTTFGINYKFVTGRVAPL